MSINPNVQAFDDVYQNMSNNLEAWETVPENQGKECPKPLTLYLRVENDEIKTTTNKANASGLGAIIDFAEKLKPTLDPENKAKLVQGVYYYGMVTKKVGIKSNMEEKLKDPEIFKLQQFFKSSGIMPKD